MQKTLSATNSAVFSQKIITTNFLKMFFLQFSTQKVMFHHLCKNQTHTLFTFVSIKG